MPDKAKIFIVAAINKATNNIYSYTHQYRIKSFNNTTILLPIDNLGEIDFFYMEKYIKAIEKLVIKDVVKYKDDVIDKTKELLNHN